MSYGVDIWCADSLVTGRLAGGVTVLAQALYRRLITPRGTLRGGDEEENYGIDLAGYVGDVEIDVAIASLPSVVRGELLKDDRVSDVVATVEVLQMPNDLGQFELTVTVDVVPHDEEDDFTLTLSVTNVSVELIGVQA